MINLTRHGAFGDCLMTVALSKFLSEHAIPCGYTGNNYNGLIQNTIVSNADTIDFYYGIIYAEKIKFLKSIYEYGLDHLINRKPALLNFNKNIKKELTEHVNSKKMIVPVNFYHKEVPKFDIVLNTATGTWSDIKRYNSIQKLYEQLKSDGYSIIDVDSNKIFGIELLNLVKNSKLYIGLETGMSHYVSNYINNGLILQSGFTTYNFWNCYKNFEVLELFNCSLKPCYIRFIKDCPYNHKCMEELTIDIIINKVKEIIQ